MHTKLIRIGNSRGVRLPSSVIEEAGLSDRIELIVRRGAVTLKPAARSREGWAEAARDCHENGDDGLILGDLATAFDREW